MKKKTTAILLVCLLLLACIATSCAKPAMTYGDYLDLGNKYLLDANYDQAIVALNDAIKIDPKQADAYFALADTYVAREDDNAVRDVSDILAQGYAQQNTDDGKTAFVQKYLSIADALKQKGHSDWAAQLLENGYAITGTENLIANIHVTVNGTTIDLSGGEPVMVGNHVYIPLRKVFNSLGAEVYWNSLPAMGDNLIYNDMSVINVIKGNQLFTMANGDLSAQDYYLDGQWRMSQPQTLPEADSQDGVWPMAWGDECIMSDQPFVTNDTTYFPVRLIAEALGASVDWDSGTQTVAIQIEDATLHRSAEEMTQMEQFSGEDADKLFYSALPSGDELVEGDVETFNLKGKFYGYATMKAGTFTVNKMYNVYWDGTVDVFNAN